jgi:hypothetical protein
MMVTNAEFISSLNDILLNKSIEELEYALQESEKDPESNTKDFLLECIEVHLERKRFFYKKRKSEQVAV